MCVWLFKALINVCLLLIRTEIQPRARGSESLGLPLSALSLPFLGPPTAKSCKLRLTAEGTDSSIVGCKQCVSLSFASSRYVLEALACRLSVK